MFLTAGLVAEAKIAAYRTNYVEVDVAGRTSIPSSAIRVAGIEAGLPICGHKDCKIPFDVEAVAAVIKRAEDEVFGLLKANWPLVKRVTNVLCKQDRLTVAEFEALVTRSDSAGSDRTGLDSTGPDRAGKRRRNSIVGRRPKPVPRPKSTGSNSGGPSTSKPGVCEIGDSR
jgi:hypothetical protein